MNSYRIISVQILLIYRCFNSIFGLHFIKKNAAFSGTKIKLIGSLILSSAGVTQLVECQLPKLNVASSNLVARSEI
jgi:hypothetical protein